MNKASFQCKNFNETLGGLLPFDRLFDGIPDIVFFVKDTEGRYMAVNDTLAARCGLAGKDVAIGLTANEVYPSPLGNAFALQDKEVLREGNPIRDRLELHLYPGGRRGWCLTFKVPVFGENGCVVGVCGISRDLQSRGEQCEDFAALSEVIEHIHSHFDEELRLPSLAKMANLSVYQFDQRIRSLFHVTAGQYLVKVRIDSACQRLACSNEAIAQIALSCGYSDQSAFSRQFKQVVGLSPMGYRHKFKE